MRNPRSLSGRLNSDGLSDDIANEVDTRQRHSRQQALNKAKNDFIAISSHQLRTPATCVKQYLGMIMSGYAGKVPDALLPFLKIAYDNNEKQLALLSTILQVAEIDSGDYILEVSEQNACELVQQAIDACSGLTTTRRQTVDYSPPDECKVVADPARIKTVLVNLLENASKNSPHGSVITVSLQQSRRYIRIRVRDCGVGIDRENIRLIFQKFTRIENEHVDTVNGNGLGLYIARKLTKKLGGTLTVTSKPQQGSTFTLTFKTQILE